MQIQVIAYSDSGSIIATDQQRESFFVLKQQSELPIDMGDILDWRFGDETITSQRVENLNKRRSVGMSMECCNCTFSEAIRIFLDLVHRPEFHGTIYAGKKRFISDANDIAGELEREIMGSERWG
jgi:NADH dehydrogenase/NADH:ubiquinone oxidoreductase subunit G